jgi:hypothetical protein
VVIVSELEVKTRIERLQSHERNVKMCIGGGFDSSLFRLFVCLKIVSVYLLDGTERRKCEDRRGVGNRLMTLTVQMKAREMAFWERFEGQGGERERRVEEGR